MFAYEMVQVEPVDLASMGGLWMMGTWQESQGSTEMEVAVVLATRLALSWLQSPAQWNFSVLYPSPLVNILDDHLSFSWDSYDGLK